MRLAGALLNDLGGTANCSFTFCADGMASKSLSMSDEDALKLRANGDICFNMWVFWSKSNSKLPQPFGKYKSLYCVNFPFDWIPSFKLNGLWSNGDSLKISNKTWFFSEFTLILLPLEKPQLNRSKLKFGILWHRRCNVSTEVYRSHQGTRNSRRWFHQAHAFCD